MEPGRVYYDIQVNNFSCSTPISSTAARLNVDRPPPRRIKSGKRGIFSPEGAYQLGYNIRKNMPSLRNCRAGGTDPRSRAGGTDLRVRNEPALFRSPLVRSIARGYPPRRTAAMRLRTCAARPYDQGVSGRRHRPTQ